MGWLAGMAVVTPREQAAFKAGIHAVLDLAMIAAVTIEVRPDAQHVRQRAAVGALQALVEGVREAFLSKPEEAGDAAICGQPRTDAASPDTNIYQQARTSTEPPDPVLGL